MIKSTYAFGTSFILLILSITPILLWLFGIVLNAATGCDIRDEGGTAYGACPEWQADIVYGMLMMMWFSMVSIPIFGSLFLVVLLIAIVVWIAELQKKKRGKK